MMVDTGILYALLDRGDCYHESAREIFASREPKVVPEAVIVETDWLVLERLGVEAEIAFLNGIEKAPFLIESPTQADRSRAAELTSRYRDAEIGYVDAVTVAIAERLGETSIATVDRRHFQLLRPRHCKAFLLLPESL